MPHTVADRINAGNEYVVSHMYSLEAQTVRELYRAYEVAYREMRESLEAVFRDIVNGGSWSVQNVAARDLLMRQISRQLLALDTAQANLTLDSMINAYNGSLAGTGYVLDMSVFSAMGMNTATLPLLPNEAIRAQLLAPYAGMTLGERFNNNRVEFELAMKRALVQSQIQGETVYQAQKRIAAVLGVQIGRRTKADRANNRAMFARTEMIARTEILRASNNGSMAVYKANRDVLRGWTWTAARDSRVCPRCAPLDGKTFKFGERAQPPEHVMCRCVATPALIDRRLENAIAGEREPFTEWAAKRGLSYNVYGQAYQLRAQKPPIKKAD